MHHLGGDLGLGALQPQALEIRQGFGQGDVADVIDGPTTAPGVALIAIHQAHVSGFAPQARALAIWTGPGLLVAPQFLAHGQRLGFLEATLEAGDDALKGVRALDAPHAPIGAGRLIAEGNLLRSRAPQDHILQDLGQILKGQLQIAPVVSGQGLQHGVGLGIAMVPTLDRARAQAQRGKGHHPLGVKGDDLTEAITGRTGPQGRVKGKQPRLEFGQGVIASRAGKLG